MTLVVITNNYILADRVASDSSKIIFNTKKLFTMPCAISTAFAGNCVDVDRYSHLLFHANSVNDINRIMVNNTAEQGEAAFYYDNNIYVSCGSAFVKTDETHYCYGNAGIYAEALLDCEPNMPIAKLVIMTKKRYPLIGSIFDYIEHKNPFEYKTIKI